MKLLPFRVVGITLDAMLDLFRSLIRLPARILDGRR
jgi:hypothetical protein